MNETLSTQEFADEHGVSRRTVQRWIAQGKLFAVKIGREYLIPFDEQPPSFFEEQDRINSDVEPVVPISDPDNAGFPEEDDNEDLEPEDTNDEEEEEEPEDEEECEDPASFERADLRKAFATRAEALSYASDIPVNTRVFMRCEDGFFQVVVEY